MSTSGGTQPLAKSCSLELLPEQLQRLRRRPPAVRSRVLEPLRFRCNRCGDEIRDQQLNVFSETWGVFNARTLYRCEAIQNDIVSCVVRLDRIRKIALLFTLPKPRFYDWMPQPREIKEVNEDGTTLLRNS
ncbi:hypothetical protein EVAR_57981_1 [Eumeta japonica]|uniref:Uncharacterized protein n=1 Tax=Eumeta variegata TaxID=151549 RepID=A0A4C1Y0F8_EUMVA|nr:hypothetical protein EVAR_57981_1 [Eumeta japonica]